MIYLMIYLIYLSDVSTILFGVPRLLWTKSGHKPHPAGCVILRVVRTVYMWPAKNTGDEAPLNQRPSPCDTTRRHSTAFVHALTPAALPCNRGSEKSRATGQSCAASPLPLQ